MKTVQNDLEWYIETSNKTLIIGLTGNMLNEHRSDTPSLRKTEDGRKVSVFNPTKEEVLNILSNTDYLGEFSLYNAVDGKVSPLLPISVSVANDVLKNKVSYTSPKLVKRFEENIKLSTRINTFKKVKLLVQNAINGKRKKTKIYLPLEEHYLKSTLTLADLKGRDREKENILSAFYNLAVMRPRGKNQFLTILLK